MFSKINWGKAVVASLIAVLGCIVTINYIKTNSVQAQTISSKDQLFVTSSVPGQLAIGLNNITATRVEGQNSVLKYSVTNNTNDNITNIQFVIFVVDKEGVIRAGQGETIKKDLATRQTSEITIPLKHDVGLEDHLVLTVHKIEGTTKTFEVTPSKVLEELSEKSLIKPIEKFVKTSIKTGKASFPATLPTPTPCEAGQTFATSSCKCGIKSFECNPSTGQYTFSCFTKDEGFCPQSPGESE